MADVHAQLIKTAKGMRENNIFSISLSLSLTHTHTLTGKHAHTHTQAADALR